MRDLDANGLRLLRLLVEKLPAVRPGDPTSYVGYKEVHTELGLNLEAETYGDSLRHQGLDSLAEWAFSDRLPAITGLIIDRSKLLPGQGFFRLYKKSEYDPDFYSWWEDQVREAKEHDWSPVLGTLVSPTSPGPSALQHPVPRQNTTIECIIRDSAIVQQVKRLHDCRCQICSHTIILPGRVKYAEGHHIKPLGSPHSGPDVLENLLCVCPNHHVELDYGAAMIDLNHLRRAKGHTIDETLVKYHNENIFGRIRS